MLRGGVRGWMDYLNWVAFGGFRRLWRRRTTRAPEPREMQRAFGHGTRWLGQKEGTCQTWRPTVQLRIAQCEARHICSTLYCQAHCGSGPRWADFNALKPRLCRVEAGVLEVIPMVVRSTELESIQIARVQAFINSYPIAKIWITWLIMISRRLLLVVERVVRIKQI